MASLKLKIVVLALSFIGLCTSIHAEERSNRVPGKRATELMPKAIPAHEKLNEDEVAVKNKVVMFGDNSGTEDLVGLVGG